MSRLKVFIITFVLSLRLAAQGLEIYDGKLTYIQGINCHGTSLFMSGLIGYPTHVTNEELEFYLINYCEKTHGPQPGAIALKNRNSAFSHSFYFTSQNEIVEKPNLGTSHPYKVRTLSRPIQSGFDFFVCSLKTSRCRMPKLKLLNLNIYWAGVYFARLAHHFEGKENRDFFHTLLQKTSAELANLDVPEECDLEKTRLILRAESLNEISRHVKGAGLLLQGLHTRMGRDY